MESGFYLAFGVAILTPCLQWLLPTIPRMVAASGIIAGLVVILIEFLVPNMKPPLGSVILFLVASFCVGGAIYLYNPHPKEDVRPTTNTVSPTQAVQPALFESQLRELQEIDQFICRKDENGLRTTFDFQNLLIFNIKFQKRELAPPLVTKEESASIDEFFKEGQARIDVRYANISFNPSGTPHVDWIKGKVGVINTSKTYIESRQKLLNYESSSQLPSDVVKALKEFHETIESNSELLIVVLNESLEANRSNLIQETVAGSPFFGATSSLYWRKFAPLKPKADLVKAAVRSYLKVQ